MRQGEVDSNRQAYWCRSGQLQICPIPAASMTHLNEENEQSTFHATHSPSTPVPKITDGFIIFDIERKQCHQIFVYRVDYRPRPSPSVRRMVKFSEKRYAPCRAKKLRLPTPSNYRDQETLPPGIADPYDSTLKKNLTPWMCNRIPDISVKATGVFASFSEPWVYCTSHFPSYRVYRELKSKFSNEYGYDAATEINDVDAFAMWLGIDFALQTDKDKHLKMEGFYREVCRASNYAIDTFVNVYHGPIHYEDESGVIVTDDDLADIHGTVRACFTKRTEFAYQSEYRFAVLTPGTPRDEIFELDISDDLRELTSPMR